MGDGGRAAPATRVVAQPGTGLCKVTDLSAGAVVIGQRAAIAVQGRFDQSIVVHLERRKPALQHHVPVGVDDAVAIVAFKHGKARGERGQGSER